MMGTIDLYQLTEAGFPLATLTMRPHPALFVGDRCLAQPETERFIAYSDPVNLKKLLRGMSEIEVGVLLREQLERTVLDLPGDTVVRCLAAEPVAYAIVALGTHTLDQPSELPIAQPKNRCGRNLRDLPVQCLMDEMETL
jgi:hypothetical protein